MTTSAAIEQTPPLSAAVDLEAFRDVCKSVSELFGIGIKIFDAEGKKLADVRASSSEHCGYLFSVHPTQLLCTNLVAKIRGQAVGPTSVDEVECFSGLRYKIMPLVYEGSVMGRVIFGPYRPPALDTPPKTLATYQQDGLDLGRLGEHLERIPRASEDAVDRVLKNLRVVLDVVIHNSIKTYLTNQVHIASVTSAFDDLERSNRALRYANERLEDLDRLKSNFIATVSHELRTPLTSVIGYSEMLLEGMAGALNEEQRGYVKTILEKGESLLGLIGQVLDLSRIENGNVVIRKSSADVREVLRLAMSDVLPQAQKRNLRIVYEVHPDVSVIDIDADKVRRIVTNLLGNAVKFTPEGGTVYLLVDNCKAIPSGSTGFDLFEPERNKHLRIIVRDTGIGIPADKLEHIFDAFFQVDNSSTREFGGTGLGLAIVKNFVHAHQGRVLVTSELGRGTEFTVTLPYISTRPGEGDLR